MKEIVIRIFLKENPGLLGNKMLKFFAIFL